ncbi:pH-response regulator protein palC [Trametes pubescens]|uniref:pH-response regulator protein palC n=1 Tax=Trametes pubescens TaxID=154538 RepID=A0A1M2W6I0_TRAPU|nr:pH-response regulator protein palC [Trametes pubescens]
MSSYLYELPTTGAVSFADVCVDSTATYTADIADTTEARANLRATLKESKRTDQGEKDYLKLVKVLDDYIPKLYGLLGCINNAEMSLKSEPIFSWRTTLSSNVFHNSPRISIPTFSTEQIFSSLTYAFSISNLARAVVHALGRYETERAISDTERKAKDEKLAFAVTLLCKAAGIYEYIGKESLAEWEKERTRVVSLGITCPRPPDLSREVVIGLSKMALADAQNLAIRKLLSKAAFESTLTPGPPLPKSHPSPALVAKLHLECASLYSSARSLVKTPGASKGASKSKMKLSFGKDKNNSGGQEETGEEVAPELRRYLADEVALHSALAHKWLGVDAGEHGGTSKGGVAVGFLAWAKKELEELRSGHTAGGMMDSDREKEMRERRKARVQEELESTSTFLVGYKRMNDTLLFQPIPPQSELQAMIPAGLMAVSVKPYAKPTPAFGPGSVEYVRRQTEELELLGSEHATDASPSPGAAQEGPTKSYAGAEAYY